MRKEKEGLTEDDDCDVDGAENTEFISFFEQTVLSLDSGRVWEIIISRRQDFFKGKNSERRQ
jgi:hypothetical protein